MQNNKMHKTEHSKILQFRFRFQRGENESILNSYPVNLPDMNWFRLNIVSDIVVQRGENESI